MRITTQAQLDEFRAGVREREEHNARRRKLAEPERIKRRIDDANISEALKDNLRLMTQFDQI